MNKETSLSMIELEIEGAKGSKAPESMLQLLDVVKKRIENDGMSYDEFASNLIDKIAHTEPKEDTLEGRKKLVDEICNNLINEYNEDI